MSTTISADLPISGPIVAAFTIGPSLFVRILSLRAQRSNLGLGSPARDCRVAALLAMTPERLEFAAAVGVVQALLVLLRGFLPGFAAAAEGAGEVRRTLFVEGSAPFLAVGRGLDQE